MNKDIMLLSNYLIYDYRLKSGSSKIHSSRLDLERNESWINGIHTWSTLDKSNTCSNNSSCWINKVLDPAHSVLFLDTDQVPAIETKMGPWIENPIEALLVSRVFLFVLL
jgi:DNA replication ATP-dependent helicase Dna2